MRGQTLCGSGCSRRAVNGWRVAELNMRGPPCLTNGKRYCPRRSVLARNGPATDHHHLPDKGQMHLRSWTVQDIFTPTFTSITHTANMPRFLRRIFSDKPFRKDRSTEDEVQQSRRVITRAPTERPDEYSRWRSSQIYLSHYSEEGLALRDATSIADSDVHASIQPILHPDYELAAPVRKRSSRRRLSKRHRMPVSV